MQEIDEVASLLDPADVREAKYGEKPCTAADLVMADAKKRAKQGKKFLSDLKDDADESNAEDVGATPPLLRKRKKTMTRRRPRKRGWLMQEPRFLRCSARRRAKL